MPEQNAMEGTPGNGIEGLDPAELLRQGAAADTIPENSTGGFTPPTPEELASFFPQFEILGLIGRGGMGAVYKVRQPGLDRIVALKILPESIGLLDSFPERFTREAKAMAKLNHAGIVTIHEFGHQGDLYYFLMEYVDGVNLRQLLENGRISPREAMAIVPQICDALQFAHDQGIVHRDIKPENILLDRLGRVKVADFGIAKLVGTADSRSADFSRPPSGTSHNFTEHGKVIGTPQYMAPEQSESPNEVDHRADIFALGVVFYQMLTGELPEKNLQPPSRKISLDVRLDEVVLRALEKDPALRFSNVTEMKTRIEEAAADTGSGVSNTPLPQKSKRSSAVIALSILGGLLILVLAGLIIGYMSLSFSGSSSRSGGTFISSTEETSDTSRNVRTEIGVMENTDISVDDLPVASESTINAKPVLRRLALQHEVKAGTGDAWLPSGETDDSKDWFPPHVGMNVSGRKAAKENPRFLCLWFSHPLIDRQSVMNVRLFEKDGETPLRVPLNDIATGPLPASEQTDGSGWITATRCAGTMTDFPKEAVVSLRYSLGPWEYTKEIPADFNGTMALDNTAFTTSPGQNADGNSFIQITDSIDPDLKDEQIDFVAISKSGRKVESIGGGISGSEGAYSKRITFNTPLREVETFRCRKRPIQEIKQPVILHPDEATLKVMTAKDLPGDNRLQVRKIVALGSPESEAMRYASPDEHGVESETTLHVSEEVIVWGDLVERNFMRNDEESFSLDIELNDLGTNRMKAATQPTGEQIRLAIIIDGRVNSAPLVHQGPLGKNFQISGFKTQEEAIDLIKSFPQGKKEMKAMSSILWLMGIDERKYEQSYEPASEILFKSQITKDQWVKDLTSARNVFGAFRGIRNIAKIEDLKSLPGVPDGEFVS